jgi:hypothetical protein
MQLSWMVRQPNADLELIGLYREWWRKVGILWLNPQAAKRCYILGNDMGWQIKVRRLLVDYSYAR